MTGATYSLLKVLRKKADDRKADSYSRKHDILYKRHGGEKALFVVMGILFAIFAVTFILPFLWILMNSFKSTKGFAMDSLAWPDPFQWANYKNAFEFSNSATGNYNFLQMLGMSVLVAGGGTLATVLSCLAAASMSFAVARSMMGTPVTLEM